MEPRLVGYITGAVVIVLVMFLRIRRVSRAQPLKLERLWIMPAVLAVGSVAALAAVPPHPQDWPWLGAALVIGAGLGWIRGRMMAIAIDADTHALNARASPAAIVLLLVVFALRFGLRTVLAENAGAWRLSPGLITDAFLLFATGLIGLQRVEMTIRGRKLLAAARAAKAAEA